MENRQLMAVLGEVLKARESLRTAQGAARGAVLEMMKELKDVTVPGTEGAAPDVVDGILDSRMLQYVSSYEGESFESGLIAGVYVEKDGAVMVRMLHYEADMIKSDVVYLEDVGDPDRVIEFIIRVTCDEG